VTCILAIVIAARLFPEQIPFYIYLKIIGFVHIFFILAAIALIKIKKYVRFKSFFHLPKTIISSIISLLLTYSFVLTFPVTIDRSFSVYLLGYLYSSGGKLTVEQLDDGVKRYFFDRHMINKRLEEQVATGSIVITGRQVTMTETGNRIVLMNKLVGKIFKLDMENILPQRHGDKQNQSE
jgi:amino acid transporter